MKNLIIFIILIFLFQGCFWINQRGVSDRYYNDCKEYYDVAGVYHKSCDKNIINW